jgi:hypothetical protein
MALWHPPALRKVTTVPDDSLFFIGRPTRPVPDAITKQDLITALQINKPVDSGYTVTLRPTTLTGNRTQYYPNQNGTFATVGDTKLSLGLTQGNTTGGTDIAVTNNDVISFNSDAVTLGYNQFTAGTYGFKRGLGDIFIIGSSLTEYTTIDTTGIVHQIPTGSFSLNTAGIAALNGSAGFNIANTGLTATRNYTLTDASGVIPSSASAGFTGTGAYTNFTIENGVITAAS